MNTDYKVGNLIYDANIYNRLNAFISDLQFLKSGYRKIRILKYFNFAVAQAGSCFQLQRVGIIFMIWITLYQYLNK